MQFRTFKLIVMEDHFFFNFIFTLQKTVGILLKIWNWWWGIWTPTADKLWPFFLFWSFNMQNTEVKLCIDIILLDDLQKVIMFDFWDVRVRDCVHVVSDCLPRRQELHSQQDWQVFHDFLSLLGYSLDFLFLDLFHNNTIKFRVVLPVHKTDFAFFQDHDAVIVLVSFDQNFSWVENSVGESFSQQHESVLLQVLEERKRSENPTIGLQDELFFERLRQTVKKFVLLVELELFFDLSFLSEVGFDFDFKFVIGLVLLSHSLESCHFCNIMLFWKSHSIHNIPNFRDIVG